MIKLNVDIRAAIEATARKYGLDPDLIEAIVLVESAGRQDASRYEPNFYAKYVRDGDFPAELHKELSTSWGLMQVMGLVAYEYGLKRNISKTLCTIEGGIWYGILHFARLLRRYEDKGGSGWDAVAAYNAGSARMKDGQYVNQGYVDKVRKRYDELKG